MARARLLPAKVRGGSGHAQTLEQAPPAKLGFFARLSASTGPEPLTSPDVEE
jgi:hypothetical protein